MHLAVDALGRILKVFITAGTIADCVMGETLLEGINADLLFADSAYDNNNIIRIEQREYDKKLYKRRHIYRKYYPHAEGLEEALPLTTPKVKTLFWLPCIFVLCSIGLGFMNDCVHTF